MAKDPEQFDIMKAPWANDADYKDIYANNVGLAVSTHDFQLRFARSTTVDQKPLNVLVATVYTAPSHAKAMAAMLLDAVMRYEEEHKVDLPVPPHLREVLAKHKS